MRPEPDEQDPDRAAEDAANPSLPPREDEPLHHRRSNSAGTSDPGHVVSPAGGSEVGSRARRARLGLVEWILVGLILLAIGVTLALAIFNPS